MLQNVVGLPVEGKEIGLANSSIVFRSKDYKKKYQC